MSLLDKFKQKLFWINMLKVALPFFIFFTLFSLMFGNWEAVTNRDFEAIHQKHFANGKWVSFWLIKIVASVGYGMYITNRKMQ
ncbi:hypothetical protein [Tenacibaculum agarivorans]|uniref:hypothetical protein n=1 Tax=Tenacibaculum agarivorans TaxID=1908389 RepID=UPI00094B84A5|nr:hypothetical protein [Tenacibaculum agarivorans]